MLTTQGQLMTPSKRELKRKREDLLYNCKELENDRLNIEMRIKSKENEIAQD